MLESILDKVTYHAVYDESVMDALAYARANGFAGVQVAVDAPRLSPDGWTDADCRAIREYCRAEGLCVSLHGPDYDASLFAENEHLREGAFRYFASLFEAADRIGAIGATLHVGVMPAFPTAPRLGRGFTDEDAAVFGRVLSENLRRLVALTGGRISVRIENVWLNEIIFRATQPLLDAEELTLCWDLPKGHDDEAVQEFMWRNVAHVRQVHLHDVRDGYSHEVVGAGTLDFMRWMPRLAEANVEEWCIEVRPREKALESLTNLRQIVRHHSCPA